MSGVLKWGVSLLIVSIAITVINHIAARVFVAQWGGPNFLAGGINLLTYIVAISGIILIAIGLREGKKKHR